MYILKKVLLLKLVALDNIERIVGMTVTEAVEYLKQNTEYILRVIMKNGHPCICTRDLKHNRVNVHTVLDIITGIYNLG